MIQSDHDVKSPYHWLNMYGSEDLVGLAGHVLRHNDLVVRDVSVFTRRGFITVLIGRR